MGTPGSLAGQEVAPPAPLGREEALPSRPGAGPRCLFLIDDHPVSPFAGEGGPTLIYSHLEIFHHSGVEIALALLETPGSSCGFRADLDAMGPEILRRRPYAPAAARSAAGFAA